VAIGRAAGNCSQGHGAVAIGKNAGYCDQEDNAVAIGNYAGRYGQDPEAIAIGYYAGECHQSCNAVAIGSYAGNCNQSSWAIAIGCQAGRYGQGQYAVAIGYQAGRGNSCCCCASSSQGDYSVAIGYRAGYLSQFANSIAINASIDSLNPGAAGLYINPVREDAGNTEYSVYYNDMTKELTYTSPITLALPQNLQAGAGDYTLVLSDAGKHIYKTNTGSVYIPTNASVAFPIGSVVTLVTGTGHATTITPVDSGTTTLILSKFGSDNSINVPADTYVTILKIETDKWMVQT